MLKFSKKKMKFAHKNLKLFPFVLHFNGCERNREVQFILLFLLARDKIFSHFWSGVWWIFLSRAISLKKSTFTHGMKYYKILTIPTGQ